MQLSDYGWDAAFQRACDTERSGFPGRVTQQQKHRYTIWTPGGEVDAVVPGRMLHDTYDPRTRRPRQAELPVVGDWVVLETFDGDGLARIDRILPRRSKFARQTPGEAVDEQVMVANVDTLLIVVGLDDNFGLSRIERYLTVAWDGGAEPVVVLTKADLRDDVDEIVAEVEAVSLDVPVHAISVVTGINLEVFARHLTPGRTLALVGSSGVGKSTLLNHLLGDERQATGEVREADSRGRHTTTHRELFRLPSGALMIDTPGMRELGVTDITSGIEKAYRDIEELIAGCRFLDCRHETEPGCRILAALDSGDLDRARWESYLKMQREQQFFESKHDPEARRAVRERQRAFGKMVRNHKNR